MDGEDFPIELSVSSVRLKGQWNAIGILRDISERKRVEKKLIEAKETAEATTNAQNEFLAKMSHEIRTPMNGVIAATDLALGEALSPKLEHYLKIISASASSLLGIINDILEFSKIEAGKLDLESFGFTVETVSSGQASLSHLESNASRDTPFDLVIMDVFGKQGVYEGPLQATVAPTPSVAKSRLGGCRVLVVEDNATNQQVAQARTGGGRCACGHRR